jgi:hypothetical protein
MVSSLSILANIINEINEVMLWFGDVFICPREIGDGYTRLQEEHKSFIVSTKECICKKSSFHIKNSNFTPPHYLKQSIEKLQQFSVSTSTNLETHSQVFLLSQLEICNDLKVLDEIKKFEKCKEFDRSYFTHFHFISSLQIKNFHLKAILQIFHLHLKSSFQINFHFKW